MTLRKLYRLAKVAAGPMGIVILVLPWVLVDRWRVFAFSVSAGLVFVTLFSINLWPHYVAPAIPLMYVIIGAGLRRLTVVRWRGVRFGAGAVVGVVLVTLGISIYTTVWRSGIDGGFGYSRQQLIKQLEHEPGKDLVLVTYDAGASFHQEYVYNRADPAGAPIVWAHDLGDASISKVIAAYPERTVWRLTVPAKGKPHLSRHGDTGDEPKPTEEAPTP